MEHEWVKNPLTNRLVKINGKVHRKLVNTGVMKNKTKDKRVAYKLDLGDDPHSIKKELRKTMKLKPNETLKIGTGKYKGKIMKSFKRQKMKKIQVEESQDNLINLYNKLGLDPPQSHAVQSKKIGRRRGALIDSSSEEESEESSSGEESEESEESD